MKPETLLRAIVATVCFFSIINSKTIAQCTVSVKGDTCVSGILRAQSSGTLKQLDWYRDGALQYSSKITGFSPVGTTVGLYVETPSGLCVDKNGNIYVGNLNDGTIVRYTPGSTTGTVVVSGIEDPNDLAIDDDTIYIASINSQGLYKWVIGDPSATMIVSTPNHSVWGVFVDRKHKVYFTVNGNGSTIYRLKPGQTEPQLMASGKKNGFGYAYDVAVSKNGTMYIASGDAVYRFNETDSIAEIVAGGNGEGSGENQLNFPVQLILDNVENMYIADQNNARIIKWVPGAFYGQTIIGGTGIKAGGGFVLNAPRGLCVDNNGNMLVSDIWQSSVLRYDAIKGVYKGYIPPATGNYSVVATDIDNCVANSTSLHVNTIPSVPASITGPTTVTAGQQNILYTTSSNGALSYTWSFPGTVSIVSGQSTSNVTVNWGNRTGTVGVTAANGCGTTTQTTLKVRVSSLLNGSIVDAATNPAVNKKTFNIYPNPATDKIVVQHPASANAAVIKVSDISGKIIKTFSVQKNVISTTLVLGNIPKGTYMITWSNGADSKTKMVLVQ